jgi:small nuclear ribonucleoprotein (snRNP)-like protein
MGTLKLVLLYCILASSLLSDQVTVKNGDRITGSIVKKDAKTVIIKSDVFGLVTIPWDQVQTVRADQPINVVLSTGETIQGTVRPLDERVEIEVAGRRQEVALAEITSGSWRPVWANFGQAPRLSALPELRGTPRQEH